MTKKKSRLYLLFKLITKSCKNLKFKAFKMSASRAVCLNKNTRRLKSPIKRLISAVDIPIDTIACKARMKGWHISKYGDVDELKFSKIMKIPLLKRSDEILIRVHSAGVNAIDVAMMTGYAYESFNQSNDENPFPLTLGREFSGEVVQKGTGTGRRIAIGDKVWGIVPYSYQGSHADYVVVPQSYVTIQPDNINPQEAGSLLYSGVTAWAGLFLSNLAKGGPMTNTVNSPKVLVLGACGALGTSVIQILKAENARVVAACTSDKKGIIETLDCDNIIDCTQEDWFTNKEVGGFYDLIVDCTGKGPYSYRDYGFKFDQFVNFISPLTTNDENILTKHLQSAKKKSSDMIDANAKAPGEKQVRVNNAYFIPSIKGIKYLNNLVELNKFHPITPSIYSYQYTPHAYKDVQSGYRHGHVILNFNG